METRYTLNDVFNLAHYSATKYAKNPIEYQQYVTFFKYFYSEQIKAGHLINPYLDDHFAITIAVAISRQIFRQVQIAQTSLFGTPYPLFLSTPHFGWSMPETSPPTISAKPIYFNLPTNPALNLPSTVPVTLNNQLQVAPLVFAESPRKCNRNKKHRKRKRAQSAVDKCNKAKIAKQIAMDMERWAAEFNRKQKEALEAKKKSTEFDGIPIPEIKEPGQTEPEKNKASLVADYFSASDSSPDEQPGKFVKVTAAKCKICKSNFQREQCYCREMGGDRRKNECITKRSPMKSPRHQIKSQCLQCKDLNAPITVTSSSEGYEHSKPISASELYGNGNTTRVGLLSKEQVKRMTYARLKELCRK